MLQNIFPKREHQFLSLTSARFAEEIQAKNFPLLQIGFQHCRKSHAKVNAALHVVDTKWCPKLSKITFTVWARINKPINEVMVIQNYCFLIDLEIVLLSQRLTARWRLKLQQAVESMNALTRSIRTWFTSHNT